MNKRTTMLISATLLMNVASVSADSFNNSRENAKSAYMQQQKNISNTSSNNSSTSMPFMDNMSMPWDNTNMTMPWDMGKNGSNGFSMPFSNDMSMPWDTFNK
jgi:hypothetical protein